MTDYTAETQNSTQQIAINSKAANAEVTAEEIAQQPAIYLPQWENIPEELKNVPQWCTWKPSYRRTREGEIKLNKEPTNPLSGRAAKVNDLSTWVSYDEAKAACEANPNTYPGVGFLFSKKDPYAGVDYDKSLVEADGVLSWTSDEVSLAVTKLNSYTEVSPSGNGVKVFLKATLPPNGNKLGTTEFYGHSRFFTVTGRRLPSLPSTIEARQSEVDELHKEVFAAKQAKTAEYPQEVKGTGLNADDATILERAFAAQNGAETRRLYNGDWSVYNSQSEADSALLFRLAFYTGPNGDEQLERIVRGSALNRPKWDEKRGDSTWLKDEIKKAIAGCKNFYGGSDKPSGAGVKDTITERIIALIETENIFFFRTERDEPFAQFQTQGHYENWPLGSDKFKNWLSYRFYQEHGKVPSETALKDALRTVAARCMFEGEQIALGVRVVSQDDGIYLDLGDSLWQTIRITPNGWEVVTNEQA